MPQSFPACRGHWLGGDATPPPSETVFTSSDPSWLVPYSGWYLLSTWGGGGGGGGAVSTGDGSGGGGGDGGRQNSSVFYLNANDDLAIEVGAGGAGGTAENPGSNGGQSSIALLLTYICRSLGGSAYGGGTSNPAGADSRMYGGEGHAGVTPAVSGNASGGGGGGGGGDLVNGVSSAGTAGGAAGTAGGGNGGAGGTSGAAVAGSVYGGGGGGGRLASGVPSAGAAGGAGKVIIDGPYPSLALLPSAEFSADDTTVDDATPVTFTDATIRSPTSWYWEKKKTGDGSIWVPFAGTPTAQNPVETFAEGTWSIRLTAANATGADCQNNTDYMTVTAAGSPPVADFSASPTTVAIDPPESSFFSDLSTNMAPANDPRTWHWEYSPTGAGTWSDLGDQPTGEATEVNTEVFGGGAGVFDIRLTVTNADGSDSETKTGYLTVTA